MSEVKAGIGGLVLIGILISVGMYGCPQYNVWSSEMSGRAELAQAEYSRKIQIEDAKGKLEAAKSLAEAEVERAKGVAKANQIIGDSLKENEAYLRYLWIQSLGSGASETIYVPTEAGLPILESGRLNKNQVPKESTDGKK